MVEFPIPTPSPPNTKSTGGPGRMEPVTPTLPNVPANLPTPGPPAVILVRSKKKSARDDAPQTKPISIAPIEVNRFMIATLMSELLEAHGQLNHLSYQSLFPFSRKFRFHHELSRKPVRQLVTFSCLACRSDLQRVFHRH